MPGEPRRVAFFTNTFAPDVNGVAHVVKAFRQELQRRGLEVYVFAPAPRGQNPPRQGTAGPRDDPLVVRFPSLPLPNLDYALALPFSRTVSRVLRQVSFDLIHTHHPLWVGHWGARYARRAGRPLVTTIHTHYELFAPMVPLPRSLVEHYLRAKVRRYCNGCDLVTTPAASNQTRLEQSGVVRPVVVVPNPVDLGLFEHADGGPVRERLGLQGKFVLGYLGRLSPEKKLRVVVQAAALVCRRRQDAHLVIVGGGTVRQEVQAAVRELGLEGRSTLVGPVPHEQVPEYQAAFDVFLTASLGETQPLAYAEALAVGTPVIAVVGLGAVDMIEDGVNGFLVNREGAAEAMAETVLRLAGDPQLRDRMSRQARSSARRYHITEAADRLLEAYSQALEEHARRHGASEDRASRPTRGE